jgi:hypothetical protein
MHITFRRLAAAVVGLTIAAVALTAPNARAATTPEGARQVLFVDGDHAVVSVIGGRTEIDPSSPSSLSVVLGVGG